MHFLRMTAIFTAMFVAVSTGIGGCHDDDDDNAAAAQPYQQVESLARPAINEGLFKTNAYLNAINSLDPNGTVAALTGPILAEAIQTMDDVDALGGIDVDPNDIVAALLPDVMRIDTTIVSGYANMAVAFGTAVRPVAGRLIEDDVIDITLAVLVGTLPALVSDGVDYDGEPGNVAQPGHKPVLATFPFLAAPN